METPAVPLSSVAAHCEMPVIMSGGVQAMAAAFILPVAKRTNALVVDEKGSVIGVVGSVNLIEHLLEWRGNLWANLYSYTLSEIARPARVFLPGSTLSDYYEYVKGSRYSFAVYREGDSYRVITPYFVLRYLRASGLLEGLEVENLWSEAVSVSPEAPLMEVLELMMKRWIRKVLVGDFMITDRGLADCYLFEMRRLRSLAADPEQVLSSPIKSASQCFVKPPVCTRYDSANYVAAAIISSEAEACVSDDLKHIATPYDLAVKPFLR